MYHSDRGCRPQIERERERDSSTEKLAKILIRKFRKETMQRLVKLESDS